MERASYPGYCMKYYPKRLPKAPAVPIVDVAAIEREMELVAVELEKRKGLEQAHVRGNATVRVPR